MAKQSQHRCAHGQKVVYSAIPGSKKVKVLDFNVHPSCPRLPTTCDSKRGRLITSPTTLGRAHIFKHRVWTTLPFYSTSREIDKEYSAFMIDDQRIVALQVKSPVAFDITKKTNRSADRWRCR